MIDTIATMVAGISEGRPRLVRESIAFSLAIFSTVSSLFAVAFTMLSIRRNFELALPLLVAFFTASGMLLFFSEQRTPSYMAIPCVLIALLLFSNYSPIDRMSLRDIARRKRAADRIPLAVSQVEEIGILDRSYQPFRMPAPGVDTRAPAERYARIINDKLATSQRKDIDLYVNGDLVIFDKPILIAAEMWHYVLPAIDRKRISKTLKGE